MSVCLHDCVESFFCNSMVCEGHNENLKFIQAKYPVRAFYLFKREELEESFFYLSKENKAICNYCDEPNCYTCNRFHYTKSELHSTGYFVARNSKWQPITWEIH